MLNCFSNSEDLSVLQMLIVGFILLHSHLSNIIIAVCAPFVPRQTLFAMYLMALIGMLVFTFTINLGHIWLVFITVGTLG